jgi:uncharacterized protein (TIGR02246 family)
MDREEIKALIEKAYEARRTEDMDAMIAVFHQDGKFQLAGSQVGTANARIAQGHRELRKTLAELIADFQFVERDIISSLIDGDRAAVHSRVKLRFIPKDRTVTTEVLDLWKVENRKIVELVEFVDTALISDLTR